MSPLPTSVKVPSVENEAARLATRTSRYCERAGALIDDPNLTMEMAETALNHLAVLQDDLATERLRQSRDLKGELQRVEGRFKPLEAELKQARVGLSNALLRAKVDEPGLFGLVPHTADPDEVIDDSCDAPLPSPSGTIRAVSASRALLDLEALRPYLSDHALRQAIEQHRKKSKLCDLRGVAYAALPASAHLPVEVF